MDTSEISDGYHTFAELYEYRMLYNALAANAMPDKRSHAAGGRRETSRGRHCLVPGPIAS